MNEIMFYISIIFLIFWVGSIIVIPFNINSIVSLLEDIKKDLKEIKSKS